MNNWWLDHENERFWLEVTDRADIGADLRAPLFDDAGKDNWRYTLFRGARVGDVVFHYQKPAIVGFSRVAGRLELADIVWAARGSYARSKGTSAHTRPGYRIPLDDFTRLAPPLTLADLRESRAELVRVLAEEGGKRKGALYFPFELSPNRDLRLLQGYAFKLPAAFINLFPGLAPASSMAASWTLGAPVAEISGAGAVRNPPWTRDELILALDLYLTHRTSPPSKASKEVVDLSVVLGAMGRALGQTEAATYRNANGVYMKLMNFRRFDPEYTADGKRGLARGNKDEEIVWNEFSGNRDRLTAVATAIKAAIELHGEDRMLSGDLEPEIQEAEEGRILTRLHRVRERSRKLVIACKERALKLYGKLSCAACAFDFAKQYGAIGDGLIDVHHTKPVHTLLEGSKTNIDDLVLLCANCHRVVHSSRRWMTVAEVRELIAAQSAYRG